MPERIGELIERRREAIVARFTALLRQRLGSHEELPTSALRDHIPDLVASLAAELRGSDIEAREERSQLADAHGELRWEQGFDLREVVGDYAILLEAILSEAEEAGVQPSLREVRRLVQQITEATSAAVSSYVALRLERERAYNEQLESLQRARHEFISVLSHELRTPLHIIQLRTHLLRAQDPQLASALEVVDKNTMHLSTLVDELLEMADLVTGRVKLAWDRVDLCSVVSEATAALRATADAKGIQLREHLDETSADVVGDHARLYQSVWQLLRNALKFTPRGGDVRLSVQVDRGKPGGEVELAVADNGRGMSSEFLSRAFEPFTQQDAATTREFGGLGIGLSLVRHIVELHGGTIDAVSSEEGTVVRVRLPCAS